MKQKTFQTDFFVEGIGIHTGLLSGVHVFPAPCDHGIVFRHVDGSSVKLSATSVTGKSRGTSLNFSHGEFRTIEHFLAALYGLGISNVVVEVTGDEMPILDGSATCWVQAMQSACPIDQEKDLSCVMIAEPILILRSADMTQGYIEMIPSEDFQIECTVDFPFLGTSHFVYHEKTNFIQDIARARTFGFSSELDALFKQGLAKGASLDNALLISEHGITPSPRFSDEPVRHKVLDLLGDLATLGVPLRGHICAVKPGHELNICAVQAIAHQLCLR